MKKKESFYDNIKTVFWAILIALIIRTFVVEPFNIPSGSMKPNLLIGDFLFVKKWSYGYSKHSFPFSIPIINNRIFEKNPKRGDIVVFKTPEDNRTDYIKRIIGLPGDKIKISNGVVILNNSPLSQIEINNFNDINNDGTLKNIQQFDEILPNKKYKIINLINNSIADDTITYNVPEDEYFVMGDNRDNSQDSRFLNSVGYIPKENLVGKAWFIFFSLENSRFYEIWKWPYSIRYSRLFNKIE
ncbi:MAG: signal peptidase I [Pelagibacteraceae bacterium]|nr:signal peptidase I [Pelagibacteraceae bacterium]|tara:strand:- start:4984 stop:5712 length:729 start_codon:yes stop_codon:yes gene_type:complete